MSGLAKQCSMVLREVAVAGGLCMLHSLLLAAHADLAHATAQREIAHVRKLPRLVRLPHDSSFKNLNNAHANTTRDWLAALHV